MAGFFFKFRYNFKGIFVENYPLNPKICTSCLFGGEFWSLEIIYRIKICKQKLKTFTNFYLKWCVAAKINHWTCRTSIILESASNFPAEKYHVTSNIGQCGGNRPKFKKNQMYSIQFVMKFKHNNQSLTSWFAGRCQNRLVLLLKFKIFFKKKSSKTEKDKYNQIFICVCIKNYSKWRYHAFKIAETEAAKC
jgi:hypothetical protein